MLKINSSVTSAAGIYLISSLPLNFWDYHMILGIFTCFLELQFTRSTEENEDKENTPDSGYPFEAF